MQGRSNCLFFAVYMLLSRGGYLHIRFSESAGGHFLWSRDQHHYLQYEPLEHLPIHKGIFHKIWYRGRITRHDDIKKANRKLVKISSWLVLLVSMWIILLGIPLSIVAIIIGRINK